MDTLPGVARQVERQAGLIVEPANVVAVATVQRVVPGVVIAAEDRERLPVVTHREARARRVVVVAEAIAGLAFDAVELLASDEVDHSADCIRTI